MADRIVVLEGGKLVEEGTHAQLLASGGRYATMFENAGGELSIRLPLRDDPNAMINSTFDVGPAAAPTEKEPEAQFQINEIDVRQKASKAANTYQALRQPQNPDSWKSEWARTQAMDSSAY